MSHALDEVLITVLVALALTTGFAVVNFMATVDMQKTLNEILRRLKDKDE